MAPPPKPRTSFQARILKHGGGRGQVQAVAGRWEGRGGAVWLAPRCPPAEAGGDRWDIENGRHWRSVVGEFEVVAKTSPD
jgi:hypothetical protein